MASSVSVCVPGQEMDGAMLSTLVTVKLQESTFPEASVAMSVTVILPVPFTVVLATGFCVIVGLGSQSVTVAREV